jgi:hypothetical protein
MSLRLTRRRLLAGFGISGTLLPAMRALSVACAYCLCKSGTITPRSRPESVSRLCIRFFSLAIMPASFCRCRPMWFRPHRSAFSMKERRASVARAESPGLAIAAVANVVLALSAAKLVQQFAVGAPEGINRSGLSFSQHRLELGKDLLDRVVVRAVGRQVLRRRASLLDGGAHASDFMGAQVVHHHDVAGPIFRHQELLDPGPKGGAIEGTVEHQGRAHPPGAQRADKRGGAPVTGGRKAPAALAPGRAAPRRGHARGRPCLIKENQTPGCQAGLLVLPVRARLDHVGPCLLCGVQGDFCIVSSNRPNILYIVVVPTLMPCTSRTHWHNSRSVCAGVGPPCARSAPSCAARRSGM